MTVNRLIKIKCRSHSHFVCAHRYFLQARQLWCRMGSARKQYEWSGPDESFWFNLRRLNLIDFSDILFTYTMCVSVYLPFEQINDNDNSTSITSTYPHEYDILFIPMIIIGIIVVIIIIIIVQCSVVAAANSGGQYCENILAQYWLIWKSHYKAWANILPFNWPHNRPDYNKPTDESDDQK